MELMLIRTFSPLTAPRSYTETDLPRADQYAFAGGVAVAYTHRSPYKETVNEDAVALIPVDAQCAVLVIADGLGGLPAGELASRLTIECVTRSVSAAQREGVSLRDTNLNSIERANTAILAAGTGAATTHTTNKKQKTQNQTKHNDKTQNQVCGQR